MLYACVAKFDVTENLKILQIFLRTKQALAALFHGDTKAKTCHRLEWRKQYLAALLSWW